MSSAIKSREISHSDVVCMSSTCHLHIVRRFRETSVPQESFQFNNRNTALLKTVIVVVLSGPSESVFLKSH